MWEYRLHTLKKVMQTNTAERILRVSTYNYLIPDMFLKRTGLDLLNKPSLKTYPLPLILKNGYFMRKKKKRIPTRHCDLLGIFFK